MSHNIIKINIENNIFKITLNEKINEIKEENLIDLFCIILSLNIIEIKNGNEYEKAQIKIKYIKNTLITEYINIFKLVRTPTIYEFLKYFITIEEKYNIQNTETKLHLNDYIEINENISQELIITMIFKIKTDIKEIKNKKNTIKNSLKIGNIDNEIFNLIRMQNKNAK